MFTNFLNHKELCVYSNPGSSEEASDLHAIWTQAMFGSPRLSTLPARRKIGLWQPWFKGKKRTAVTDFPEDYVRDWQDMILRTNLGSIFMEGGGDGSIPVGSEHNQAFGIGEHKKTRLVGGPNTIRPEEQARSRP